MVESENVTKWRWQRWWRRLEDEVDGDSGGKMVKMMTKVEKVGWG